MAKRRALVTLVCATLTSCGGGGDAAPGSDAAAAPGPSSFESVAGRYRDPATGMDASINASGSIAGIVAGGCRIRGNLGVPHPGQNTYTLDATLFGGGCYFLGVPPLPDATARYSWLGMAEVGTPMPEFVTSGMAADGTMRAFRLDHWQPLAAGDRFRFELSYEQAATGGGSLQLVAPLESGTSGLATLPIDTVQLAIDGGSPVRLDFPTSQGKADARYSYRFAVPQTAFANAPNGCLEAAVKVADIEGLILDERFRLCDGTPLFYTVDRVIAAPAAAAQGNGK